jgi:hypothetical protein
MFVLREDRAILGPVYLMVAFVACDLQRLWACWYDRMIQKKSEIGLQI